MQALTNEQIKELIGGTKMIDLVHGFILNEIQMKENEIVEQILGEYKTPDETLIHIVNHDERTQYILSIEVRDDLNVYEDSEICFVEATSGSLCGSCWARYDVTDKYIKVEFAKEYMRFLDKVIKAQNEYLEDIYALEVHTNHQVSTEEEVIMINNGDAIVAGEWGTEESHLVNVQFNRISKRGNPVFDVLYDDFEEMMINKLEEQAFALLKE